MRNNTSLTGVNVSTETVDAVKAQGSQSAVTNVQTQLSRPWQPRMEVKQGKRKHRQLAQLSDGNVQPSECTHLPCLCVLTNMDVTATPEHFQCSFGSIFTVTASNFCSWVGVRAIFLHAGVARVIT